MSSPTVWPCSARRAKKKNCVCIREPWMSRRCSRCGRGDHESVVRRSNTSFVAVDSAEKPYECFDWAQHERRISNAFYCSFVRPEATRRMNGGFSAESQYKS